MDQQNSKTKTMRTRIITMIGKIVPEQDKNIACDFCGSHTDVFKTLEIDLDAQKVFQKEEQYAVRGWICKQCLDQSQI